MIFLEAFFFLTILCAVRDIATKHSLKSIDPDVLAWYTALGIFLITFPIALSVWLPNFSWELLGISIFTWMLYFSFKFLSFTAFSLWDISYISPLRGLVTVFSIIPEFLILWNIPNKVGIFWVILIALWAYIIAIKSKKDSVFEPIRRLFTDKASQLMFIVVIIASFTLTFDKIGVGLSTPYFWISTMQLFIFLFSLKGMLKKSRTTLPLIKKNAASFFTTLFLNSITLIFQMHLVQYMYVSYVSAFKSSSNIVTVIFGWLVFKEKNLKIRTIGTLVMTVWIIIISFSDQIIALL
jgi:drug/metabolite transporter (DMT)-like permease